MIGIGYGKGKALQYCHGREVTHPVIGRCADVFNGLIDLHADKIEEKSDDSCDQIAQKILCNDPDIRFRIQKRKDRHHHADARRKADIALIDAHGEHDKDCCEQGSKQFFPASDQEKGSDDGKTKRKKIEIRHVFVEHGHHKRRSGFEYSGRQSGTQNGADLKKIGQKDGRYCHEQNTDHSRQEGECVIRTELLKKLYPPPADGDLCLSCIIADRLA